MYESATDIRPDADSSARAVTVATAASPAVARPLMVSPTYRSGQTSERPMSADPYDPAGGIVLSGRNRLGERARAMAGLFLTTGVVVALTQLDTAVSLHGI